MTKRAGWYPKAPWRLVLGAATLMALLACGDDADTTSTTSTSTTGTGGVGGTGGAGGVGGFNTGTGGTGDYGCSADLHYVIDANGSQVVECAEDEGCLDGACVQACAAAAGSHGNLGCDFRVSTPGHYPNLTAPPCFAVFVTNAWPRPAMVTVSLGGTSYDVGQFGRIPQNGQPESAWPAIPATGIPVGEVGVLFLSHDPSATLVETGQSLACPVTPALSVGTVLAGSGVSEAFHIGSDTPISGYDMLPYGGAPSHVPSAQLLFPTTAWGTNYVMIATPPGSYATPGPLWGQILATEDNTSVQVLPAVDLPAAGDNSFLAAPANVAVTFAIPAAGQTLQWELAPGSNDLSGTVVLADKPVAVFAGNRFYRNQPMPAPGGDSTHQQNLAVDTMGHLYAAAPFETRRDDMQPEPIGYRVVGAISGTTLSYDPAVTGAPTSLTQGQVVDFEATGPFQISSQDADHPFTLAQVMRSSHFITDGGGTIRAGSTADLHGWPYTLGDEEFVVLLPPAQFLQHYVFFTDPSYPTTNLVITRSHTDAGFHDVDLDCLGTIGGWQPVGSGGQYEVATVDLIRAGVSVGSCLNGRHTAASDGPFGIVVWGLDAYSSYAYPAGGNAAQLTDLVVPPMPN